MTDLDDKICEQLCAWMDGELEADQARFLERRLANEPALRAKFERMQLASACLKGQQWRPMAATLPARVEAALAVAAPVPSRRAWIGWAAAASLAALAFILVPRGPAPGDAAPAPVVVAAQPLPVNPVPSPASADLVAVGATVPADAAVADRPVARAPAPKPPRAADAVLAVAAPAAPRAESPLPLSAQSPTDFPLVETGEKKSWPRSPLSAPVDDPSLEAYLVRHNQMMSGDGLGGFVPYVDVVASDKADADSDADASAPAEDEGGAR